MNAPEALRKLKEDRGKADFKLTCEPQKGSPARPKMTDDGEGGIHSKSNLKKTDSSHSFFELEELRGLQKNEEEPYVIEASDVIKTTIVPEQTIQSPEFQSMTQLSRKEFCECTLTTVWPETPLFPEIEVMGSATLSTDAPFVHDRSNFFSTEILADVKDSETEADLDVLCDFKDFAGFYNKSESVVDKPPRKFKCPAKDFEAVRRSNRKRQIPRKYLSD